MSSSNGRVSPMQFVRIHGHDVAYRTAGEGPVLVLIHGIAGSSATWARVMPGLAERHTVVAPDLLGHGDAPKPHDPEAYLGMEAGVLDAVQAEVGDAPVDAVGFSLGARTLLNLACAHPGRFRRIVVAGAGAGATSAASAALRASSVSTPSSTLKT